MTDRLTYAETEKNEPWLKLIFPLMLFLGAIATIPFQLMDNSPLLTLSFGNGQVYLPLEALSLLLLLTLSGFLTRSMVPVKSSTSLKAFAAICGIGIPFVFLQGFLSINQTPFYNLAGTALILASWVLLVLEEKTSPLLAMAAGLVSGLACSVSPICYSGAAALLVFGLCKSQLSLKEKFLNTLTGLLAFTFGMIPAIAGLIPIPLYQTGVFEPEFFLGGVDFIYENIPVWAWIFAPIGLVVAFIQKQPITLCLIFPFLIFRILFAGFQPLDFWGVESTLLLPFAWLSSYGLIRAVRGIEQGVRKVNVSLSKQVPVIACGAFIAGFLVKIADLFYFYG